MPGIEKRLARYPQLYSRIGFVHEYRLVSAGELAFVLQRHWAAFGLKLSADDFTDTEAIPPSTASPAFGLKLSADDSTDTEAIPPSTASPAGTSGSSSGSSPRSPACWRSTD